MSDIVNSVGYYLFLCIIFAALCRAVYLLAYYWPWRRLSVNTDNPEIRPSAWMSQRQRQFVTYNHMIHLRAKSRIQLVLSVLHDLEDNTNPHVQAVSQHLKEYEKELE